MQQGAGLMGLVLLLAVLAVPLLLLGLLYLGAWLENWLRRPPEPKDWDDRLKDWPPYVPKHAAPRKRRRPGK
jgi:hypothetical protein